MKGMKVNVENIGKTVTNGFDKVNDYIKSEKPRSILQRIGETIVGIIGYMIKTVLVIAAICFTPILFILLIICFLLLMVAMGVLESLPAIFYYAIPSVDWSSISNSPYSTILMTLSGILVIGIPLVGLIYSLMSTLGGWKEMSATLKIIMLIIWLISLGTSFIFMLNSFTFVEVPLRNI